MAESNHTKNQLDINSLALTTLSSEPGKDLLDKEPSFNYEELMTRVLMRQNNLPQLHFFLYFLQLQNIEAFKIPHKFKYYAKLLVNKVISEGLIFPQISQQGISLAIIQALCNKLKTPEYIDQFLYSVSQFALSSQVVSLRYVLCSLIDASLPTITPYCIVSLVPISDYIKQEITCLLDFSVLCWQLSSFSASELAICCCLKIMEIDGEGVNETHSLCQGFEFFRDLINSKMSQYETSQ